MQFPFTLHSTPFGCHETVYKSGITEVPDTTKTESQKFLILGRHLQTMGDGEHEEVWVIEKFRSLFDHFDFTQYRGTAVQLVLK
eukprot:SAG11_NODE_182_length_13233_cov_59.525238_7_plen_84_part_00